MGQLEVQNLVKSYGSKEVIANISFSVRDGEFFVLLGPSGGGKSTILKVISGIEKADSGRILLADRDITNIPPRDRNVGMVFQDYGLYPHMNVFENIAYGLEARGMPRAEIATRVKESADRLGLTPLIDRVIVDLSGGEQQRVSLARALAKDAEVYLFDEPISNLDPKLRAQARRDIIMLHRMKQKPSLYVTHDQNEALAIADRIAIIAQGKLQQVGTSNDLIQNPANLFVAGFIGTPPMNLLSGILATDGQGQLQVEFTPGLALTLPDYWNPSSLNYQGKRVVVGIPPAAIYPAGMAADSELQAPLSHLEGEITFVEALVSEIIVALKFNDIVHASAVFTGVDESELDIGSRLRVAIDGGQIRLFDPETELAFQAAE
ncbi:MAG: glycerol-3-phosphate ABC transporter ATP-binding protein [Anaerolinea sp.]|nr:glycerol-3-phosphate ABC transporter ATP-binding protein [Anaerolinea sp.]